MSSNHKALYVRHYPEKFQMHIDSLPSDSRLRLKNMNTQMKLAFQAQIDKNEEKK